MSISIKSGASRLPADARRLTSLAEALALSGSRVEDIYWENQITAVLAKLLKGKANKHVETALESLVPERMAAYEILVEMAETCSESTTLATEELEYDILLFSAPLLVWTRYQLPLPSALAAKDIKTLTKALHDHVFAADVKLALLPDIVSFEQMPQTFHETARWTQLLGQKALGKKAVAAEIKPLGNTEGMLADARFIVGAVAVPKGQPVFCWQKTGEEVVADRQACLEKWQTAISPIVQTRYTACTIDYLQPDAYYLNSREADRRIRPLALKSAVIWLQNAANMRGPDLQAAIVACGDTVVEEYRVGFTTKHSNQVIYGCVWPILSKEEAISTQSDVLSVAIPEEIAAHLSEVGVTEIKQLSGLATPEICEDCGAPFFPNAQGEMMHPELPEETDLEPRHFH